MVQLSFFEPALFYFNIIFVNRVLYHMESNLKKKHLKYYIFNLLPITFYFH